MLLLRRARELGRQLPAAMAGDDVGVHQARVASRRLREAVPVLAADTKIRKKAERKIRRVTQALGTVREMDVTVQILDEFARGPGIPRDALEDVRGTRDCRTRSPPRGDARPAAPGEHREAQPPPGGSRQS